MLKSPFEIGVITSCAVNAKWFLKRCRDFNPKQILYDTMTERAKRVLDIAVRNKHDAIVLGIYFFKLITCNFYHFY